MDILLAITHQSSGQIAILQFNKAEKILLLIQTKWHSTLFYTPNSWMLLTYIHMYLLLYSITKQVDVSLCFILFSSFYTPNLWPYESRIYWINRKFASFSHQQVEKVPSFTRQISEYTLRQTKLVFILLISSHQSIGRTPLFTTYTEEMFSFHKQVAKVY